MRLLLDTHVLIWWFSGGKELSESTMTSIASDDTEVFVSAASIWEMAIKAAKGKLQTPGDVLERMELNRFHALPIGCQHALAAGSLPLLHEDPFDRMLVAQAIIEDLVVVTRDPKIRSYAVKSMEA